MARQRTEKPVAEKTTDEKPVEKPADEETHEHDEQQQVKRCPSCRAEIENNDVAHFDMHKDHDDRIAALENTKTETANADPNISRGFNFDPYLEKEPGPDAGTTDDETQTNA